MSFLVSPIVFLVLPHAWTGQVPAARAASPTVFVLDSRLLMEASRRLAAHDPELMRALNRLVAEADAAMAAGPFTVMKKDFVPPSGDKHDYMSLSIYWWPNPDTPDGLPYVNRDGQYNPEADLYDGPQLSGMAWNVSTLALAWYFTGQQRYAERAALLLRTFFLDPDTCMNPNLDFAQGIPGRSPGNFWGIIESVPLAVHVVDAIGLLRPSGALSLQDLRGLERWFSRYLGWLRESPAGKQEEAAHNNHGSWYDVQVAAFALFLGRPEVARKQLQERTTKRIALQIQPDGKQPFELLRTKSFDYCIYNLQALFAAASLGQKIGVDLWNFATPDGRSIRKAVDFLIPYAQGKEPWPWQTITGFHPDSLAPLLRRAAIAYNEPAYEEALAQLPGSAEAQATERYNLLWPPKKR
ncbi:MAG: alginate lyase family protein [Armatimonadetes bacterium]|nr:alginate lyase family protein [Armatimonadota bacterium]